MVVIKLLQKAGGRVNVRNTAGMTPLAYAASRGQAQLVSTLISMGCPVDTRNRDGTTPLHQAATAGNQVQLNMQLPPSQCLPVIVCSSQSQNVYCEGKSTLHWNSSWRNVWGQNMRLYIVEMF